MDTRCLLEVFVHWRIQLSTSHLCLLTICDVTNRARRPRLLKSDLNSAADFPPHGEASACSQTSAVCAPSLVSCRLNGERSHINIPACCREINIISMTWAVGRTGGFSSATVGVHCDNAAVRMIIYCMLLSCCEGLRSDLYGLWFTFSHVYHVEYQTLWRLQLP